MSSLETLCLDLIVEEFGRFYYAFTTSKDANLKRNLEFLQRRYSFQIIKELYEYEELKDKYFSFLINEHLEFLDGKWFSNSRYLNRMEDIFRRLPNLTGVCFNSCGDEILENIAKFCPKIVKIDVRRSKVTDTGVEYLCKSKNGKIPCPELKTFLGWPSHITSQGAEDLIQNLPLLEKIDYNLPLLLHDIYEENLSRFGKVRYYNLVDLNLIRFKMLPDYSDILKTCLTVCPKLESLACHVSNKEQLNWFSCGRLKELHLQVSSECASISTDDFFKRNGCNLTYLMISNCTVSVSALAAHCPVLKQFFAHRVQFTGVRTGLHTIFPNLTECTFSEIDSSSSKPVCSILSSSPILKSISFMDCTLSSEMQAEILKWCKNPSASNVDFYCLGLKVDFLRDILLNCPTLKDLTLTDCTADIPETTKILKNIAKDLPNKPNLMIYQMFN